MRKPLPRPFVFLSCAARSVVALLLVAALFGCAPKASLGPHDPAVDAELEALTGARSRLVWTQDLEKAGDIYGRSSRTALVGYDTADGLGERLILPEPGFHKQPLITSKGDRVVFTDFKAVEAWIVNWDGTGLRRVAPGFALEVWQDPEDRREYAFIQSGPGRGEEAENNPIFRHLLDGESDPVLMWDRTPVTAMEHGSFQVSADGTRAAGLFPWPAAGVADFEKDDWERIGSGCWTGLAPDNTYRPWIFDGAHRNLFFVNASGRTRAKVGITDGDGSVGGEVYHPRWSSHPRFFALTSPYYFEEGKGMVGSANVEVLVGRFDSDFSKVEAWVTITNNRRGDYFPDLWVDRDPLDEQTPELLAQVRHIAESGPHWPGDKAGLAFIWENDTKKNGIVDPAIGTERICRLVSHGFARFGPYYEIDLRGGKGWFEAETGNDALLAALRATSQLNLEATIVPERAEADGAPIIVFGDAEGGSNFALTQDGERLTFHLRTTSFGQKQEGRVDLGAIQPGVPLHVTFSYGAWGEVRATIDGVQVADSMEVNGSFVNWKDAVLSFGGRPDGDKTWSGRIDGVAIYDSILDQQQMEDHEALNQARLAVRETMESVTLRGTLRAVTGVPPAESIAPYRRCLVVYQYDVDEVLKGDLDAESILAAHWGMLDAESLAEHRPLEGESYILEIEPFDANPQLGSERMEQDMMEFELPLFYDPLPWSENHPRRADAEE